MKSITNLTSAVNGSGLTTEQTGSKPKSTGVGYKYRPDGSSRGPGPNGLEYNGNRPK